MVDFRAGDVDQINLPLGEDRTLESLRQAVVPPFVMIVPFLELPKSVELIRQEGLDEDGVHGCVFTLRGVAIDSGTLRVGFRDLRSGKVVIERTIPVQVR
jgi:hypothetical protein